MTLPPVTDWNICLKLVRSRYQQGSLQLDTRKSGDHMWIFRYSERQPDGSSKRRGVSIGPLSKYPTESAAKKAAGSLRIQVNDLGSVRQEVKTLSHVIDRFIDEEVSERASTRRSDLSRIENHIRPVWGDRPLETIKALEVRQWLRNLDMSAKSKSHFKGLLARMWSAAMLWEWVPLTENPMSLIRIEGSSKRAKRPVVLTIPQFQAVLAMIDREPFRTMVLLSMCVGTRRSEFIALKWSDFLWEEHALYIRRGIVDGKIGEVKTKYSEAPMPLDPALALVLQKWRMQTAFAGEEDWVFASPHAGGDMPYWPNSIGRRYIRSVGEALRLGRINWHTLRHTYRSWLATTGADLTTQQFLMRHADIRTTMNVYGQAMPENMRQTNGKVVEMVLPGSRVG